MLMLLGTRDPAYGKGAEEAVSEDGRHLTLIYDHVADVIFLLAVEPSDTFRFASVNATFLAVTGLRKEQVIGKRVQEVLPESSHALVIGNYKTAIRERKPVRWEEVAAFPSGRKVGEVTLVPIFDAAGTCTHLIGAVHDVTEARQLQEAVQTSEQTFRMLFANNPLPMWVYDLQTLRFLEVNEAAIAHYGYTREEFLQMCLSDIRPPEDVPRLLENLAKERPELQASGEWRHRRKTGELFDVHIASHRLTLHDRGAVLVVSNDVTDRKRAESALHTSEARKAAMLDTALDAIITIDDRGKIIEFNRAAEQIFGYTRGEAMGRQMAELIIPPHLREQHYRGFARYLATNDGPVLGKRIELSAIRANGMEFPVELAINPIVTDGPPMFTAYLRDISDRKRTEEERLVLLAREQSARAEAEEAQRRSAFLAEASKLLAASLDYHVTLGNVASAAVPHVADWCVVDMVGADQSVERLAVAHVDPAKAEMIFELQRRYRYDPTQPGWGNEVFRTSKSVLVSEIPETMLENASQSPERLRIIRAVGNPKSLIITPIMGGTRVVGLVTFVAAESGRRYSAEDVAMVEELARRAAMAIENARHHQEVQVLNLELERRVADRTAGLEAANKELESFSYSVAHDLRAPLRALDGFSRLAIEEFAPQLPSEAQRYLSLVRHNAQQMGQLIDDLLAFSRLGRKPVNRQRVRPTDVVRQAVQDLEREHEGRAVKILIGELPECDADPALLKQVFLNLLSNALKFTRNRDIPCIEVQSRTESNESIYSVKDNGVGFDMQYAGKLFSVFQRLHSPEEYEGTGVGLAIVQRIVHRHGGRIWAEAEVDKGATFHFTLGGASDDGRTGGNPAR
jgi:PAS domain S-box-containing protein